MLGLDLCIKNARWDVQMTDSICNKRAKILSHKNSSQSKFGDQQNQEYVFLSLTTTCKATTTTKRITSTGFEPAPIKTATWKQRLRPLGHDVDSCQTRNRFQKNRHRWFFFMTTIKPSKYFWCSWSCASPHPWSRGRLEVGPSESIQATRGRNPK